ncbi:Hypothetical protein NCS54_01359400 [Fusarium falciforme]|uniref:Hypothetical protein n=1 Tax=Fusarium falciforme TaxID=195108 RepID=UPI0023009824|nr:Hypothetical protein NCS54_01359400 [Fusarium falciforme]WAO95945.1 Hypothetical protein NCS54_01359400 [Fusarium falciforme]
MSDSSIRETIEFDDSTPSLTEHDHTPSPGDDDDDSFREDFDHADSSSLSTSEDEANESLPAESDSRNLAEENHGSPSPKKDAQKAVIAAARAQNTDLDKMVKQHDHEIGNLMDEFCDHVSSHEKTSKAESEKHIAFQNDVGDRFASLEQSVVDRILLLGKITSSRMTRLEKIINARFASPEQSMNYRFAELEERID